MRTKVLTAMLAMLALLAAPAEGAVNRSYLGIASTGFVTEMKTPQKEKFLQPYGAACGVAIAPGGTAYVADYYRGLIDTYSFLEPPETFPNNPESLVQIPAAVGEDAACDLAVDSGGRLYAGLLHGPVLVRQGASWSTVDPGPSTGIAVDGSDRLYVAHRDHVAAYEPDGSPVLSGGQPLRIGLGTLADGYGVAVSGFGPTLGRVYVADAAAGVVRAYDPSVDPLVPVLGIDGAASPQSGFSDLTGARIAVDDSNGHLLVVDDLEPTAERPRIVVGEYGVRGSYLGQLPRTLSSARPSGLTVDNNFSKGRVYVTSTDATGSKVHAFGPAPAAPTRLLEVEAAGSGGGAVVSSPAGIACGTACVGEFDAGAAVTLSAVDDGHSAFAGWDVTGQPGACPGTGPCQVTLSADTEVTASFSALPQQQLAVGKGGAGEGTVRSEPAGIECGSACDGEFNAGSAVTLTAEPSSGSAFAGWDVTGQPGACPGTGPCQVTLSADTEVEAVFAPAPARLLSVFKAGSGRGEVTDPSRSIACGPVCAAVFGQGSIVALRATAAPGSVFAGWAGAGCAGTGVCPVRLDQDAVAVAVFERLEPPANPFSPRSLATLAVRLGGEGSGRVLSDPAGIDCGTPCAGAYSPGSTVTLSADPDPGSRFGGWRGCSSASGTRCTVVLGSSRTVDASFEPAAPLRLGRLAVSGARATLAVQVPGRGVVTASAKGLRPARATARRAGAVTLALRLRPKAERKLAQRGRLPLRLRVAFESSADGGESVAWQRVVFKRSGKRGAGR